MRESVFDKSEFSFAYPDGIENHYWHLCRNSLVLHLLKEHGLEQLRILDVGCGRGISVGYLRSRAIDCWGVEPAPIVPIVQSTKWTKIGIEAQALPLDFRASVQVLLLLDVIEHIQNPHEFLIGLLEVYPNVASVLLTVPARKELWSNYDTHYGHFRRYDISSTRELFTPLNLVSLDIKYFFHFLYWPALIMKAVLGRRSVRVKAPGTKISMAVHKILARILIAEALILPVSWRGSSLMCLVRLNR